MFVPPERFDLSVTAEGSPQYWAEQAMMQLRPVFDPKKPTALFVGRYQPFHEGHRALIAEGLKRVGQACIAVRNTQGTDDKNPFSSNMSLADRTRAARVRWAFHVVALPNITHMFYGRDVGYAVERVNLDQRFENARPPIKSEVKLSGRPQSAMR